MIAYEIEIDLVAKVLVPETDEAAARDKWTSLFGATIDLYDTTWLDGTYPNPFTILGAMRISALRRSPGALRRASKKRLHFCLEAEPIDSELLICPDLNTRAVGDAFPLTVKFTAPTFIEQKLRSSLEDMIDEPPRTHVDLEDAAEYWLTMVGFDSDMFPMVISRRAVIGSLSSEMIRPRRDKKTGEIVEMHSWSDVRS
ncbi:hypothetical protein [Rhizobium sp.]|uniref:hypothetical protein n=1 Tax=Rhizobium sp. TaxID=391 RepID=UPI002897E0E5